MKPIPCRTLICRAALVLAFFIHPALGVTIVWDFEGEQNLADQSGVLTFTNVGGGQGPGTTWSRRGADPSAPVRYDAINDENSITSTPGGGANDWLVRADWNFDGTSHQKHADGDSGILQSDAFFIDETSSFTFDIGGGSPPNGLYLRRVDDDSVIISESRGGGFLNSRDWNNAELNGAGVTGKTEVYLTIEDQTTGGWGNVSVDNIVIQNGLFPSDAPDIRSFTSNPPSLPAAGNVTLVWDVRGAESILIDNRVGDVTGMTSKEVAVSATTTFTLTATNADGESTATVSVAVEQAPVINSFTAGTNSAAEGAPVTLSWDVDFGDTLSIDQGVGDVTGRRQTVVTVFETTTYALTAINPNGRATAEVTIEVVGPNLVWDFEGRVPIEDDPLQDRLYDRNGDLKFHLVTPGQSPPGNGDTFDRFEEGIPTNPVRYDAINDENPITDTLGADPTNEWLIRADWNFNGVSHMKHGDGDTGEFISDVFGIDQTSSFTMDVGGGSLPNGLFLHRADDDGVIISESRGGGFVQQRDWTNAELTGAGIAGPTEVYLRIADATTGGWGNVSVDNLAVFNAMIPPDVPKIKSLNASPALLATAGTVTLEWDVENAEALSIDNRVGDVTGLSSKEVSVAATTTFTLTATNREGDSTRSVIVGVNQRPIFNSFTADQLSILPGRAVLLSWEIEFAEELSIDQGVGDVTGETGVFVNPERTTTYTLTATNPSGSETIEITIEVPEAPDLVFDFEGRVEIERDPMQDRLYDQSGNLKFHLVTPDLGDTFDRFEEGVPSNPVRYDAINDENPINDTPGSDPTNEWLIRADWSFNGDAHTKHGDGDTGAFISDVFEIDDSTFFTMDVGGGSLPNGFFLHRADDDSVIISESRGGGFVQPREWTNSELQGAGVDGPTDVYLRIADATTGGWGNVSVDNIAGYNVKVPGAKKPFNITSITHDPASGGLTIQWESEGGFLYNLRSETGLSTDPSDWPIFGGNADLVATPPENSLTIPKPPDLDRYFVIERFPAPPEAIFAEHFDGAAAIPDGWIAGANTPPDTGTTVWEVGTPTNAGPAAANSPPNCAATNIADDYGLETDIYLRTPAIDLAGVGSATLTYFQFIDIEEGFDAGSVLVLDASDGSELAVLESPIDGASADWEEIFTSLPAVALGKSVMIEFRFEADDISNFAGWYLDDVAVTVP